ncbi:MAG: DUF58 domain-containing protein [Candidatus Cloacimonadales bacterium]|jgi:uncharacterized protein (DUF58 family)|nr:DUF58 domain-containing protein [Candidatus Cloacimonadota bacterium]MDD2649759.1 DUF58 domain-containing protein [Candidatus Cloacimonadota bacterium]MDD3502326.1 DUF58 domain-containing protein [Candidatus Cloacimonadota bacterium]MDX9977593.1 DUF58 domain-containing protein [Candidatus Cloacimonadales bacterium]
MEASEILKKIRKIEITTRALVNEVFSGEYHSMFKGHGLEFAEVREYQEGDSYKEIDWMVTARMGKPHIKKFNETRELNVFFLVDKSASSLYGTYNNIKSDIIAEITALLSFSALSNNDKVGLILFSDQIEQYSPPRKGKRNALKILRDILYYKSDNKGTKIEKATEFVWKISKKRSIIFIISDFYDEGYEHSLRILSRKHDVVAFRIVDPSEITIPDAGIMHMQDPETGKKITVNTSSKRFRENFHSYMNQQSLDLEKNFKKMKIDLLTIKTNEDYIPNLIKFFKNRVKRIRKG